MKIIKKKRFKYNKLIYGKLKSGGRNNQGRITVRYIGGGHKKKYRLIDFKRNKYDVIATVKKKEYDPNRSSYISLLYYKDGEKKYILSVKGLKIGDRIISSKKKSSLNIGDSTTLDLIPLGTIICCVENIPGNGAIYSRSAGTYSKLISKDKKYAIIKLSSNEKKMVLLKSMATIGSISNKNHKFKKLKKAGNNRWLGKRPRTRGVAMNPIDHPMGGGEGKASGGHPKSRKGIYAKGFKTRKKNKKYSKYILK
ncbi:50S ribosomal protein L2 [Candidatus Shikimatogenerans bostrichidophilus]|uniref:50S ribosomal protein L2 n=1 Tax=Candidatus Shikimatogenerans bostrichidophilus TaxID=2943807 RepID=UPI002966E6A6